MDSDAKRTILLLKMKNRCSDEHSIVNYGNPVSWSYVLAMAEKLYRGFVRCYYIDWYLFSRFVRPFIGVWNLINWPCMKHVEWSNLVPFIILFFIFLSL